MTRSVCQLAGTWLLISGLLVLSLLQEACTYTPKKLENPYETSYYRKTYPGFRERKQMERNACFTRSDKLSANNCLDQVGGSSFEDFIHRNQFDPND